MPFDEYLYSKVSNYFKKNRKQSAEEIARTVELDKIKEKLTIIARANTGKAIDIFHAEREGGYRNNSFFLPSTFSLFDTKEENDRFYVFRVLYLSIQQKLNLNWFNSGDYTLQLSQLKSKETAPIVLQELFNEFPITEQWHGDFINAFTNKKSDSTPQTDTTWLYGKWMLNTQESDNLIESEINQDTIKKAKEESILTTLKARAIEEVISIEVDKKQQEDYVLTHNFEKVDTAEEFDGIWRDFDGDDDLKEHEEALDELKMKYTVRVDDTAHSVYQADFIENTTISESKDSEPSGYHVLYDEWDYSHSRYKRDFCKVYPSAFSKSDVTYYNSTISKNAVTLVGLRKMLANVNNKLQQQRRQLQGNEFDIDAITDLFVDVHSRHTPSENIYISNRKIEKDISILLLLDVSLSSDGYADGNRIIDVEKQVSILFGVILNEFNVDFAICSFYSKTRNYSNFITLKSFDDNWNSAKYKIGAVEPDGFTRIGAALRHSGTLLQKRQTKNKWVILLSDGKPNDFDKYEGKYGVNDVKQALRELKQQQINAYALAIEAQAKYYLPQMFGQNHYQILTTPVELLQSMVKLYEKIKHST